MRYLTATSVSRASMNVTRAALESGKDDGFDEAHDRTDGSIPSQAVAGDGLFALFVFLGDLEREGFGGLLENTLGLFRALEEVADLFRGGHFDGQLLSEQQGQLIAQQDLAGVGDGNGKRTVVKFERNEVITEHQVRGNGPEQVGVDALLAQIDEAAAISLREFARDFALVKSLGAVGGCPIVFRCGHNVLTLAQVTLPLRPRGRTRRSGDKEKSK